MDTNLPTDGDREVQEARARAEKDIRITRRALLTFGRDRKQRKADRKRIDQTFEEEIEIHD